MSEVWESGDPYEYFMGRWSHLVGDSFLDWLTVSPGKIWLDVGCGTGALSASVLSKQDPAELIAIDQSEGFVESAQQRLGSAARCEVGNAMDLSFKDSSFDYVISGLVLNFIPEPENLLREMKRVTAPRGTVAIYVWDYSGKMEFLQYFWDAVVDLDPAVSDLHEATRFPDANKEGLQRLFENTGFTNTIIEPLEIETNFEDFDDYWSPFLGGQGPAPAYVLSLDESERNRLRDCLKDRLPIQQDGSIPMNARAWAAKSTV
ncbi:MAG: class I SAM-dependent methyltransferase [Gammaproteobacteria bacterium]|jgi:ubiquinone/menaquinone biosynthesis C-methylase UbiE